MEAMTEEKRDVCTRQKEDIREAFERWARWRAGARYHGREPRGGEGGGILGQLRNGSGSRACPTCKGSGRMPGHLVGSMLAFINVPCPQCDGEKKVAGDLDASQRTREIECVFCYDSKTERATGELPDGRTCHKCKGGKRLLITLKVHPAIIKSTRHFGQDPAADPVSALIERTVEAWGHYDATYWLARVVIEEYCHNGTQEMKAQRLGVSRPWYTRNLTEAHQRMAVIIKI